MRKSDRNRERYKKEPRSPKVSSTTGFQLFKQ